MRSVRRLSPIERRMQRLRNQLAEYDLERLAEASLIAVVILSGIWSLIFK